MKLSKEDERVFKAGAQALCRLSAILTACLLFTVLRRYGIV